MLSIESGDLHINEASVFVLLQKEQLCVCGGVHESVCVRALVGE